jgi:DNA-binding MarR family transcriptional regulator
MEEQNDCGLLLKKICDAVERINNANLKRYRLTDSQLRYLIFLYENQSRKIPMKKLEEQFQVAQPTVAGIVRRLEEKNLIKTAVSAADSRAKTVELSAAGLELLNRGIQQQRRIENWITDDLTRAETEQLRRLLNKVYASVGKSQNLRY